MKKKSVKEYLFFIESCILLAAARLVLVIIPFKRIAPLLGEMKHDDQNEISDSDTGLLDNIKIAILRGSRYSPWRAKCFEQAIAAKLMLRRRRIRSTLYLGVFKKASGELLAHAWLKSGGVVITGGPVTGHYTILSYYCS